MTSAIRNKTDGQLYNNDRASGVIKILCIYFYMRLLFSYTQNVL